MADLRPQGPLRPERAAGDTGAGQLCGRPRFCTLPRCRPRRRAEHIQHQHICSTINQPPPATDNIHHLAVTIWAQCYTRCRGQLHATRRRRQHGRVKHGEHSGHEAVAVVRGPLRPLGAVAGRGPATSAPAIPRALTVLAQAVAPQLAPARLSARAPAPSGAVTAHASARHSVVKIKRNNRARGTTLLLFPLQQQQV